MEMGLILTILNHHKFLSSLKYPPKYLHLVHKKLLNKKKGLANNFSIEEDMLLISAWQNISLDPIQGSNQTHQTYWNRIAAYYEENKKISSERTHNSLSHRWSVINTSVSKFIGYYIQIEEETKVDSLKRIRYAKQ